MKVIADPFLDIRPRLPRIGKIHISDDERMETPDGGWLGSVY